MPLTYINKSNKTVFMLLYSVISSAEWEDVEIPDLEIWLVGSISSLPLLSGSLRLGVLVPLEVRSIGQIDLFNIYLYSIGLYRKKKNA